MFLAGNQEGALWTFLDGIAVHDGAHLEGRQFGLDEHQTGVVDDPLRSEPSQLLVQGDVSGRDGPTREAGQQLQLRLRELALCLQE